MIRLQAAIPALGRLVDRADVVAVGPGLGQSEDIRGLVHWLIESNDRPLVIDADALNVLARDISILKSLKKRP
ncbi:MAG: NAD(P)H-hydrate dehydratase [Isosphaeraceae bacterium]